MHFVMRVILVTGCSSGIGLHCARRLAGEGWRVFAAVRRDQDLQKLAQLAEADRVADRLTPLRMDLDDSASIRRGLDAALAQSGGRLDAVFNNAGFGQPGAVEDLTRDALRAQFETNVFGLQELTNAVVPLMAEAGGGRVVQNSSLLGYAAIRWRGAYTASKHAVEALTLTMRQELAGTGVHAILICPGPVESRFRENATAKFRANIDAANSRHRAAYEELAAAWQAGDASAFTLPAESVYAALKKALEAANPAPRYLVTFPAHLFWWLRKILPERALERIHGRV